MICDDYLGCSPHSNLMVVKRSARSTNNDFRYHLWPERVIPKCATDHRIAIAHGLEDIYWVERDDGKWSPQPTPTRPVDELVRERTSIAVKASLKSLLDAPVANANGGRVRGRRAASGALDRGVG